MLGQLGHLVVDELGGSRDYTLKLTSGFHPDSGVRGGKPKDLWFGVYRKDNERRFLGNPQVFMMVSERGIEYGLIFVNPPLPLVPPSIYNSPTGKTTFFLYPDVGTSRKGIARSKLPTGIS